MRSKINFPSSSEYLVYILSTKGKETLVEICRKENFLFEGEKMKFPKLIYFENYNDRAKALRRKMHLDKLDNEKRFKLIKRKNPELLNLIFAVFDN